jgi:di/tricarboxylate transporter
VCIFYSFPTANGTLEKLAGYLIYRCRAFPELLPFAIFFVSEIIALISEDYYITLALMTPFTLLVCQRAGFSLVLGGMAANYGAVSGTNFVTSQSGVIFRDLMISAGVSENTVFVNATGIFASTLVSPLLVITAFVTSTALDREMKPEFYAAKEPTAFNAKQKATLLLMLLMVVLVFSLPLAQKAVPDSPMLLLIDSKLDMGLIASLFSIIAWMLKLGDCRHAMASVPWGTLILICGISMLISMTINAGAVTGLFSWLDDSVPALLVPVLFGVVAAVISFFSSTLAVVTPALFPLVPPIAPEAGLDPMILFIAIVVGAQSTSISPFSTGGCLIICS